MTGTYSDVLIRIRPLDTARGTYPVEAELGDGAMYVSGELRLDLDRLAETQLDPAAHGLELFNALFAGPMRPVYEQAFVQAADRPRVRLWIDDGASELHGLAWEGMYHELAGQPAPLVVSTLASLSRYIGTPMPAPPPVPAPEKGRPIRMLFAVSSPGDLLERYGLPLLDVDREAARLRESIGRLLQSGLLSIRLLVGSTGLSGSLQQELEAEGYEIVDGPITLSSLVSQMSDCHLVHLMCHGATHRAEAAAALFLEDDDGRTRITRAEEFASMLAATQQLPRLLFLMSGDSPRGHGVNPHVELGATLVNYGIPAAIVMQDVITIHGASLMANTFYESLLRHGYVDRALSEARLYLYNQGGNARRDWLMPVLFTKLKTGQLISLKDESVRIPAVVQEDLQVKAGVRGPSRSAHPSETVVPDLARRLRQLAESLRQLHILVDLANQLQQLQEGFYPCVMMVQQAGTDLLKIQVAPLTWAWQPLRDGSLKRLQLFLQKHSQLPVSDWFPPLLEQAQLIDSSLEPNTMHMGNLARGVTTFSRQLAEAEPYVRQQMDQAITELVSFSDQTLGRLDQGQDSAPTRSAVRRSP